MSPGKLLERSNWKGNGSDDDMCQIDDKDDITASEVKLNSSLISDEFKVTSFFFFWFGGDISYASQ